MNVVVDNAFGWGANWAAGVPLIVLNVLIHIVSLGFISSRTVRASRTTVIRRPMAALVLVAGATTLLATCLHGIEAGVWATAYVILGAFPDFKYAMLYSLNAMTSFGHTNLSLKEPWQLLGALEALNGWLLFGLTTAFLFAAIHAVWSSGVPREEARRSAAESEPAGESTGAVRHVAQLPTEYPR
jgi:hypothetical protein